jgi:hypothetical protein
MLVLNAPADHSKVSKTICDNECARRKAACEGYLSSDDRDDRDDDCCDEIVDNTVIQQ